MANKKKENVRFTSKFVNQNFRIKVFGRDAIVQVEIHEVACPFEITDVQVCVLHWDDRKRSPLLEQTIINALPDWYTIKHEYDSVYELTA